MHLSLIKACDDDDDGESRQETNERQTTELAVREAQKNQEVTLIY